MAKTPLLPGALGRPAAAILIPVLLLLSFATTRAYADGEGAPQASPAAESTAPAGGKKPEEAAKAPLAEAADAAQAAPKETKAAEKPLDAKPADAAAADDKKPSEPKEAKAGANPADADSSAPKPAGAKEAKADPKPKDITPRPENTNPVRSSIVNAVYRISWLGAHIGDFRIHSSITNRQYSLQANADLSVFFGTVSWKGVTSSHGLMTANGPVPKDYTFRYSTNDRREAIELRFQQRMVQDIIINPPARPGGRNVPITAAHLQNVVDPLSAIVLLSQSRLSRQGGGACNKRLPIFDGRVRYDLVLSSKGTRTIGKTGKLRGTAYVCKVHYVPIAGHKAGKRGENDYATGNTGIEVWLVPLPEAGLLIPYYVHVPTPAGTASMVTAKFNVETPAGRHAFAD